LFTFFSSRNKNATINKRIEESWIAAPVSFIEFHVLKIPMVYVFTPKYFTAPYSFKTSIITRKRPEKIAGFESGIIILKKDLCMLNPRVIPILINFEPIKLKDILETAYMYGNKENESIIPKTSNCKKSAFIFNGPVKLKISA
jgi:hypothetical protein